MSRAERDKGARGELEVAKILRVHGFEAERVPNSGGLFLKGDVVGVGGVHFEVKRQETIRLPEWIRQAELEAGDNVAIVAHRTNRSPWYATLELKKLAWLLAIAAAYE